MAAATGNRVDIADVTASSSSDTQEEPVAAAPPRPAPRPPPLPTWQPPNWRHPPGFSVVRRRPKSMGRVLAAVRRPRDPLGFIRGNGAAGTGYGLPPGAKELPSGFAFCPKGAASVGRVVAAYKRARVPGTGRFAPNAQGEHFGVARVTAKRRLAVPPSYRLIPTSRLIPRN